MDSGKLSTILYSNKLDVKKFENLLSNNDQGYKFFWLEAILKLIARNKQLFTFEDVIDEMIVGAWRMVIHYHLRLGHTVNGNAENFLEHAIRILYECSKKDVGNKSPSKDRLLFLIQKYQDDLMDASDGGMVAQIYTQKYHGEVGGLILISTGGMDEATLKSLKKKYFFAPLMLFYMNHCNYEKLKPKLIRACMGHIRNESEEQVAYAQDMFETIFKDYTREKDVHISGLLADLMNQTPVTEADFRKLEGKILLILPDQDFFSGKMQKDLIQLMHGPEIKYVSGGHLSTVLKVDDYVQTIRSFLQKNIK